MFGFGFGFDLVLAMARDETNLKRIKVYNKAISVGELCCVYLCVCVCGTCQEGG